MTHRCPLYKLTVMEGIGPYIRKRRDELDLSLREPAKSWAAPPPLFQTSNSNAGTRQTRSSIEIAKILKVKAEDLRKMDVRAPIDDIKRITHDDPTFAVAFRTVIDKK